jgi:hypothetical protein
MFVGAGCRRVRARHVDLTESCGSPILTIIKFMIDSIIEFFMKGCTMARETGSKNFSPREMRLKAENGALKAKLKAEQAASKVKDARIKELKAKK